LANVVQHW